MAIVGFGLLLGLAVIGNATTGESETYSESPRYEINSSDFNDNSHARDLEYDLDDVSKSDTHAQVYYQDAFIEVGEDDDYVFFEEYTGDGTDVWVNGVELTWDEVYMVEAQIGMTVLSGDYWLDDMGNYGYAGGPAMGNLYSPYANYGGGQGGGWSSGGMDSTMFGNVGGGNFYDSSTGCSYMPGSGVSC